MQVLQDYTAFADAQLGRWHTRPDGSPVPGVRALTAPLLQLFYGEKVPGVAWLSQCSGVAHVHMSE
jgi:hypothetical protein